MAMPPPPPPGGYPPQQLQQQQFQQAPPPPATGGIPSPTAPQGQQYPPQQQQHVGAPPPPMGAGGPPPPPPQQQGSAGNFSSGSGSFSPQNQQSPDPSNPQHGGHAYPPQQQQAAMPPPPPTQQQYQQAQQQYQQQQTQPPQQGQQNGQFAPPQPAGQQQQQQQVSAPPVAQQQQLPPPPTQQQYQQAQQQYQQGGAPPQHQQQGGYQQPLQGGQQQQGYPQQQQQQYQQQQVPPQQQQQQQFAPPQQQGQQQQQQYNPQQQQYQQQQQQQQRPPTATDIVGGMQAPNVPPPTGQAAQQIQQQVAQQQDQSEQVEIHPVSVSRATSAGKINNNETFPRLQQEDRDMDLALLPKSNMQHVKPARRIHLRPNTHVLPANPQLEEKLGIPLSVTIQPLGEDGKAVPLVDYSTVSCDGQNAVSQVPRCRRCKAYINCFAQFTDGGKRWQCNLCRSYNEVSAPYFTALDNQTGLRRDVTSRPELCHGTYDISAPAEYLVRPPQRPVFVWMLDVSFGAVSSGLLKHQCAGILKALEEMENDDATYVSFIAYDSNVYLFNLRSTFSAPKMIVAPDLVQDTPQVNENNVLEPVELPALLDDLVVQVAESYDLVKQLMEKLPGMFKDTKDVDSAFGPALNTAMTIISPTGGKIIGSLGSMPSIGDGALKPRDKEKKQASTEHLLCQPATEWYKQRSIVASQVQVSIDLMVNDSVHVDLASIAPLAKYTSGHIYRYNPFSRRGGGIELDCARLLLRETGFEAVLRMRCAGNVMVTNCFGHCYVQDSSLLRLPVTDCDTAYTLQLKIASNISTRYFYFQTALLYTTRQRERRIRVSTFQYEVSQYLPKILNSFDCTATANLLMRHACDYATNSNFTNSLAKSNEKLIALLKNAKNSVAGKYGAQLALPKCLKFLPQMMAGYWRQAAVRNSTVLENQPDDRVASQANFMTMPPGTALSYCVPVMYCCYNSRLASQERLPAVEIGGIESLRFDGIYLISLGTTLVAWYGKSVDPRVLEEFSLVLKGDSTYTGAGTFTTNEDIQAAADRFHELVAHVQSTSIANMRPPLKVMGQGDQNERVIFAQLIEEDAKESLSFGQYLALLQRKVTLEN